MVSKTNKNMHNTQQNQQKKNTDTYHKHIDKNKSENDVEQSNVTNQGKTGLGGTDRQLVLLLVLRLVKLATLPGAIAAHALVVNGGKDEHKREQEMYGQHCVECANGAARVSHCRAAESQGHAAGQHCVDADFGDQPADGGVVDIDRAGQVRAAEHDCALESSEKQLPDDDGHGHDGRVVHHLVVQTLLAVAVQCFDLLLRVVAVLGHQVEVPSDESA